MSSSDGFHVQGDRPAIRAFFTEPVLGALRARQIQVEPQLRHAGLSSAELQSPYAWIPLARYLQLFDQAATVTRLPCLGMMLGCAFRSAMLGPFAPLMQQSGTLGAALRLFARFQRVWQTGTTFAIVDHDGVSRLSYRIDDPRIGPRRQDAEFTLAALIALVQELADADWHPLAMAFQHPEGAGSATLRAVFRAPIAFDSVENWIAVEPGILTRPLKGAQSSAQNAILERHLMDLLAAPAGPASDVIAAVREIIDRCLGREGLTAEAVARELNLSVRSLRRRLAAGGTSFRDLLQDRRRLRAETMLMTGSMPLARIAEQLGYTDAAVLSRAFRDWTGAPPSRFVPRSRHHGRT